jgi:hypothetical protein
VHSEQDGDRHRQMAEVNALRQDQDRRGGSAAPRVDPLADDAVDAEDHDAREHVAHDHAGEPRQGAADGGQYGDGEQGAVAHRGGTVIQLKVDRPADEEGDDQALRHHGASVRRRKKP